MAIFNSYVSHNQRVSGYPMITSLIPRNLTVAVQPRPGAFSQTSADLTEDTSRPSLEFLCEGEDGSMFAAEVSVMARNGKYKW